MQLNTGEVEIDRQENEKYRRGKVSKKRVDFIQRGKNEKLGQNNYKRRNQIQCFLNYIIMSRDKSTKILHKWNTLKNNNPHFEMTTHP